MRCGENGATRDFVTLRGNPLRRVGGASVSNIRETFLRVEEC